MRPRSVRHLPNEKAPGNRRLSLLLTTYRSHAQVQLVWVLVLVSLGSPENTFNRSAVVLDQHSRSPYAQSAARRIATATTIVHVNIFMPSARTFLHLFFRHVVHHFSFREEAGKPVPYLTSTYPIDILSRWS